MKSKATAPRGLFPRSIGEALEMAKDYPAGIFWAGGTWLGGQSEDREYIDLPSAVISLARIEELKRASRRDRFLELGAMITLDRLASLGTPPLPPGFTQALSTLGTRPLRCRATLGGHLGMAPYKGDLWPLLAILDTQVELRFLKVTRRRKSLPAAIWLPLIRMEHAVKELEDSGSKALLTRVRIPNDPWNYGKFQKILPQGGESGKKILFAGLAQHEKGLLTELHLAFSLGQRELLRDRNLEADLSGRSLPFTPKERDLIGTAVENLTASWNLPPYEKFTLRQLTLSFLDFTDKNT